MAARTMRTPLTLARHHRSFHAARLLTWRRLPLFVLGAGASAVGFVQFKLSATTLWINDSLARAKASADLIQASFSLHLGQLHQLFHYRFSLLRDRLPAIRLLENNSEDGNGNQHSSSDLAVLAAAASLVQTADTDQQNNSPVNNYTENDDQLLDLTKKLIEVRNVLKTIQVSASLVLPSIVVIGSQSSGKSSVLEAIVGREFLPKGGNMVTRRPLELTLIHTPNTPSEYAEFPQLGLGAITDFYDVQRILLDLNKAVPEQECVSNKPIELRIYSDKVPDLSLVDLPGYIQIHSKNQPETLKEKITEMCEKYIAEPNIILAVSAADVDLANSEALRASRKADPMGLRTVGVITKLDLVSPDTALAILRNSDYPLHMGYVGIVCKPSLINNNNALINSEAAFFRHHPELLTIYNSQLSLDSTTQSSSSFFSSSSTTSTTPISTLPTVTLGIPQLRRTLMHVLQTHMSSRLFAVSDAIENELAEANYHFKVQYNDRRITAESYLAECMDALKHRFKDFARQFGKPQVRTEVRNMLEHRVVDICEQVYWSDMKITELPILTATLCKKSKSKSRLFGHDKNNNGNNNDNHTNINSNSKNNQTIKSGISTQTTNQDHYNHHADNEVKSNEDYEVSYWIHKLNIASSLLTKSGVGRASTQLVVDTLMSNMERLVSAEPFLHHADTRRKALRLCNDIIRHKFHFTADQVENTIKPYKFEVECTDLEWQEGAKRAVAVLEREMTESQRVYDTIKSALGRRKLNYAITYLTELEKRLLIGDTEITSSTKTIPSSDSNGSVVARHTSTIGQSLSTLKPHIQPHLDPLLSRLPSTEQDGSRVSYYTDITLQQAREALYHQHRMNILRQRLVQTKKSTHSSSSSTPHLFPEIFLTCVADKLTYTATMFINIELLNEFFFQFPRDADERLYYGLTNQQIAEFARENKSVLNHLELMERKRVLEVAKSKVTDLVRRQEELLLRRKRLA